MAPQVDEMPRVDAAPVAPTGAFPTAAPATRAPAQYPQPAAHPAPPAQPPYAWMPPAAAPAQPSVRYAGFRLALAIVSLALFIPLAAIALGAASTFNATFGAWVGALIVIGAVEVGVNVAFNYWLEGRHR